MAEEIYMSIKSDVKSATEETKVYAKTLKEAQTNVKDVNTSLQAQNKVILQQERELLNLKATQDSIPKGKFYAGQAKLTKDIKQLTGAIKLEKQTLKDLKFAQKDATEKVKEFNQAQKEVGGTLMDDIRTFKVFGLSIAGIGAAFNKITPMAKIAFATIKAGMLSTGIGVLIVAFGFLTAWFTKTKKGAESLSKIFAGVGAAVKVFVDRFIAYGKLLFSIITLDFPGMAKNASDAFRGLGDELSHEIRLARELSDATFKLADSERKLRVETAKKRADIEEYKKTAEDLSLTEKERLTAAEAAFKMENDLLAKRIENAKTGVEIIRLQNSMSDNMDKDLDALAEKEIVLANIRMESTTKQIELNNKINSIKASQIAKEKAITDKEKADKKEADDIRIEKQRIIDEKKLADDEAKRLAQLATIAEFNKLSEDLRIQNIEDVEERERAEAERKNQIRLDNINATVLDEKEKDKVLLQNKEIFENESKAIFDKFRAQYEAESDEDAAAEIERQKLIRDAKVGMAKSGLQLVGAIAGKGSKIAKAAAVAQATISGVQGVQNAYSTAQLSPITVAFPGYPIVQAGLAAAFSAVQIRNILSSGSSKGGMAAGLGGGGAVGGRPSPQMMGGGFSLQDQEPPEAIKAFVVTDEMTSSQNQLANIRRRSTI